MNSVTLVAAIAAGALVACSWNPAGPDSSARDEASFAFTGVHVVNPARRQLARRKSRRPAQLRYRKPLSTPSGRVRRSSATVPQRC